jgi:hypothetical protein
MLGVSSYPKAHVAACRARVAADLAAHAKVKSTPDFEAAYFNALVLALDRWFVHRLRKNEGKDGNALNEVRVLCDSLVDGGGVMTGNPTIRMTPHDALLGYEPGDEIALSRDDFERLAGAFLDEIESRYPE